MALPTDPEEHINFAATKFQALWRGYAVRNAEGIFEKKDEKYTVRWNEWHSNSLNYFIFISIETNTMLGSPTWTWSDMSGSLTAIGSVYVSSKST